MADVVCADYTRQFAWSLEYKAVVEHLDWYFSAFDAVVMVADRVYYHLLYHESGIFAVGSEYAIFSKICVFFYLGFKIVDGLLYLVEDASLNGNVIIMLQNEEKYENTPLNVKKAYC